MRKSPATAAQLTEAGLDGLEVWSQPNLDQGWRPAKFDIATYVRVLQETYVAVKAANPDILLASGGASATGFFGAAGCTAQGCNDDAFFAALVEAGAADYLDCVGITYIGDVAPDQTTGSAMGDFPTFYFPNVVERAATAFADTNLPLCITSIGYFTPDGLDPAPQFPIKVTLEQQATWLQKAVEFAATDERILMLLVWNMNWSPQTNDMVDPVTGFSIIRPDGTCPACEAIAALKLTS